MIGSLLQPLIEQGESARAEFKRMIENLEVVGQTVCSFLNAGGGTLVAGVTDNGEVVGIENAQEMAVRIQQDLSQYLSPPASYSVGVEEIEGKPCLIVDVPPGSQTPHVYRDGIFVRRGALSVLATGADISGLLQRRRLEPVRWERLPALGADMEELDQEEIARTAALEQQNDWRAGRQALSADDALQMLNLTERGMPLNSAIVLFARQPARRYPQIRARVARFASDNPSDIVDHRTFEGHAFALLEQTLTFLKAHLPAASALPVGSLVRTDKLIYPPGALREALVNALMHRDYAAFDGGVAVRMYPDRIEFWNSGALPQGMTAATLRQGYVSRPHNPDIAHIFLLRGLAERMGIGARRIVAECVEAGLPEPTWEEKGGGILLTLRRTPAVEASNRHIPLSRRQAAFLEQTPPGERITAQEYHRRFASNVSDRQARTELGQLVEMGYMRREGSGPATAYARTSQAVILR